jgi:hypothetical protein
LLGSKRVRGYLFDQQNYVDTKQLHPKALEVQQAAEKAAAKN